MGLRPATPPEAPAMTSLCRTGACEFDWRRLETLGRPEDELTLDKVDDDDLPGPELLGQDPLGKGVLDVLLNRPTQRPRPELSLIALVGDVVLRFLRQLQPEALGLHLDPGP